MTQYITSRTKAFIAGGTLPFRSRVRLVAGQLQLAGATDTDCIGVTDRPAFAQGDRIPVTLLTAQGTVCVTASAPFSAGPIYAAAGGQVAGSGSVPAGVAFEAATAQGDYVEALMLPPIVPGSLPGGGS